MNAFHFCTSPISLRVFPVPVRYCSNTFNASSTGSFFSISTTTEFQRVDRIHRTATTLKKRLLFLNNPFFLCKDLAAGLQWPLKIRSHIDKHKTVCKMWNPLPTRSGSDHPKPLLLHSISDLMHSKHRTAHPLSVFRPFHFLMHFLLKMCKHGLTIQSCAKLLQEIIDQIGFFFFIFGLFHQIMDQAVPRYR